MFSRANAGHRYYTRRSALPLRPRSDAAVQPVAVTCKIDEQGGTNLELTVFGFASGRPQQLDRAGCPAGRIEESWNAERHWMRYLFTDPKTLVDSGFIQTLVQSELQKHAPYNKEGDGPMRLPFNAIDIVIKDVPGVYSLDVNVLPLAWLPLTNVQRAVGSLWRPTIDELFRRINVRPTHYSRTVDSTNTVMNMTLYCSKEDPSKQ